MERTIKPSELETAIERKQIGQIIDVRRKADFEADKRTIPGAVWRDPEKVGEWSDEILSDREAVIYCVRGGSVSNGVLDHLLSKNIKARFIEGGLAAWDNRECKKE